MYVEIVVKIVFELRTKCRDCFLDFIGVVSFGFGSFLEFVDYHLTNAVVMEFVGVYE